MLEAALPFKDGPARVVVLSHLRKDGTEINLSIAEGTEPARPVDPILIAAIDAGTRAGAVFGIFDVKGANAVMIEVDKPQVIHLLKNHVARIVKNVRALVPINGAQEAFKGGSIMEVFAGMQLVAEIDASLVEDVENREPATAEFREGFLDKTQWALRPRIEKW